MTIEVAALLFAALAVSCSAAWAVRRPRRSIDARVRALARRGVPTPSAALSFHERIVGPALVSLGDAVASALPPAFLQRTQRRLVLAGEPMKAGTFYAAVLIAGVASWAVMTLLIVAASGGSRAAVAAVVGAFASVVGAYLPAFWLSARAKERQRAMLRGLPDSLDLLTICVEAGLGLDAAFHRVIEKQSGPLIDEMRHMLREIGLGRPRRDALLSLADRTDLDDVRSFVLSAIQAEQLGTSVGQALRAQSDRLRVRRRQRAEQEARRAPVKMVFPLVFCLMPALFIFVLGPIIVNLAGFLSQH